MHSLGTMTDEEVEIILSELRAYNCKRILIVTMVTNWLHDNLYVHSNQTFFITRTNEDKVTVEFLFARKSIKYTDNCYSMSRWLDMATKCGYFVTVER